MRRALRPARPGAHSGARGQRPQPTDLARVAGVQTVAGHRGVIALARSARSTRGVEPDGGERRTHLDTLGVPCVFKGAREARRRPVSRDRLGLRLQVGVHPYRALRQMVPLVLGGRLMVLAGVEPPLDGVMHRGRQIHAEDGIPGHRLGADIGMDIPTAIVAELVALALGLDRDPVNPRARGPLALGAGGEVGRHDPDIPDQPVHEHLHRLGQAAASANRFAELGAGSGALEHRPVERKVTVQPLPDRARKHRHGTGEELIKIHFRLLDSFSCMPKTFRPSTSPGLGRTGEM